MPSPKKIKMDPNGGMVSLEVTFKSEATHNFTYSPADTSSKRHKGDRPFSESYELGRPEELLGDKDLWDIFLLNYTANQTLSYRISLEWKQDGNTLSTPWSVYGNLGPNEEDHWNESVRFYFLPNREITA